jgi:hypothetical protein
MRRVADLLAATLVCSVVASFAVHAQWLHVPYPNAPRLKDGSINMKGPVPRLNGKPDLSGVWQLPGEPRAPNGLFGLGESLNSKYFRDILSDFPADARPLTPEGADLLRQHSQPGVFNPTLNCLPDGVPHGNLLPEPFKIVHSRGLIVMLYEVETTFRQVYLDGRAFPVDPSPTWQGYSVGRWEGDTLVINTMGFNDRGWLDARGTGHSTELKVEERFTRRDYGHLELQITLTDPRTFTQPISFKVVEELLPDTDVLEHYCLENERDDAHTRGSQPRQP